jgi:hypothetical protein
MRVETVGNVDVETQLDKRHAEVVRNLKAEWAALMAKPPCEERTIAADMLLDRANALGVGRLDRS